MTQFTKMRRTCNFQQLVLLPTAFKFQKADDDNNDDEAEDDDREESESEDMDEEEENLGDDGEPLESSAMSLLRSPNEVKLNTIDKMAVFFPIRLRELPPSLKRKTPDPFDSDGEKKLKK